MLLRVCAGRRARGCGYPPPREEAHVDQAGLKFAEIGLTSLMQRLMPESAYPATEWDLLCFIYQRVGNILFIVNRFIFL